MKVFISQPMNGRDDLEIMKERNRVIDELSASYGFVEEINSFFTDECETMKYPGVYMLGRSLKLMADADLVYFVKGWQYGRGCVIEHDVAIKYGLKFIEEV